jgi:Ca-activated chloride channel family protein
LAQEIVDISLRFGVLCRFTGYVAVDMRVVNEGGKVHRVTQPVELPSGWELTGASVAGVAGPVAAPMAMTTPLAARAAMASPGDGVVGAKAIRAHRFSVRAEDGAAGAIAANMFAAHAAAPGGPVPAEAPTPASGIDVRQIAIQEAAALRLAESEPQYRRRDLLDDLASRLDALVRYLAGGQWADALRALVVLLRDESKSVGQRWTGALSTLDKLAGGQASQPGGAPGEAGGSERRRGAFWRRA